MNRTPDPENDPNTIIQAPNGSLDYGLIDNAAATAAGVPAGRIRLLNGWPGAKAWGYRHVLSNPNRVGDIRRRGYSTPVEYAYAVAQGWKTIHAGPDGKGQRITIAMPEKEFQLALAMEWNGKIWSVTTMLPFRSVGYPKLYER